MAYLNGKPRRRAIGTAVWVLALFCASARAQAPRIEVDLAPGRPIPGRYIVTFHDAVASPDGVAVDLARVHGLRAMHVYTRALRGFAAEIPPGRLAALARDPRVRAIEADQTVKALAQAVPSGIARIFAPNNPNIGINGNDDTRIDIDIAVIDTGIDNHPDLNLSPSRTDCTSGACIDGTAADGNGHGTHVSGTIGAIDNGAGVVGVAPGARLWGVRVLDATGSGSMSGVIAGVDWVTAHAAKIKVANMSLGGGTSTALCAAIHNSVAAGVTYAVAAGNSSTEAETSSPANCADAITVSAVADYNGAAGGGGAANCANWGADDSLASFSNYSATIPLIAAPGVCIYSTWTGGGYNTISGTSMSAPHVAGAAALLAASGTYTPAQIRQLLYANGNFNWTDTAPDKIKEPLLDVGNAAVFKPRKLAGTSGGSGGSADTTPPSVSVLAPASGANLTGTVLVRIKAADNVTPAANLTVTWQLDSSAARSATYNAATGYFEANWDTTQSSSTAHLLSASATDAAKNTATSAATTVTVANAAPPTASMIGLANHLVLCTVSGTDLLIGLTMLNNLGAPVGGAVVSLNITRAQGGLWSGTGMTGSNGAVTFRLISAPSGVYATQFLAVSATLPWNKVQPTNVCSK